MARRYENGEIVGETDPPESLEEIIQWCQSEHELARKRADSHDTLEAAVGYLNGRAAVLKQLLPRLERVNALS